MLMRRLSARSYRTIIIIIALLLLSLICLVSISTQAASHITLITTPSSAMRHDESELNSIIEDAIDHLIIVPGHSILDIAHCGQSDKWILLDYQKKSGLGAIISSHIEVGMNLADQNQNSILIFSGGQTRASAGPVSEGLSYYLFAEHNDWFGSTNKIDKRVFVEEFARDSYENLLFSICRFHQVTSSYPKLITVVGFDFKKHRFEHLHLTAISFPSSQFDYIGLVPTSPLFDREAAVVGEKAVVSEFEKDLYGCESRSLSQKKMDRNPFKRYNGYSDSCGEIRGLLEWCHSSLYPNSSDLPWNQ